MFQHPQCVFFFSQCEKPKSHPYKTSVSAVIYAVLANSAFLSAVHTEALIQFLHQVPSPVVVRVALFHIPFYATGLMIPSGCNLYSLFQNTV